MHWLVCAALKRKGKGDDVTEDDMDGFVAAHNGKYALLCWLVSDGRRDAHGLFASVRVSSFAAMNEATWQQVVMWEQLHADKCGKPTLLRFMGKPHDLRYSAHFVDIPA